jgi:hypothetical protein
MNRLEAALKISEQKQRVAALASVCTDSAKAGLGEVVLQGVAKIGEPALRDQTAAECALSLHESGQGAAANDVAKQVSDPTKRDDVLKSLSSGS